MKIYNINPLSGVNDHFNFVPGLDIDAVLSGASPAQTVSESFQVRFGQEGKYFTKWGGITFDEILIEDDPDKSKEIVSGTGDSRFMIYYDNEHIYIRSFGEAVFEEKQVIVYDLYGRTIINRRIPPGSLSRINVTPCSCYMVVKVLTPKQVTVEKVFVR